MITGASATDIIRDRISELAEKIKNGDTEKSYQIGAQSFTDTEWSFFLEQFDSIQEEMVKEMREGHEHMKEKDEAKRTEEKRLYASHMGKIASGDYKHMLDSGALFSICHAPTGETANIYRSESYSEENQAYIVRGIDINGDYYEKEIDAQNINPEKCSYVEVLVWSVHMGNNSPSDYLKLARMRGEAGETSYLEQINYSAILEKLIEEMKMVGALNDYKEYNSFYNQFTDK